MTGVEHDDLHAAEPLRSVPALEFRQRNVIRLPLAHREDQSGWRDARDQLAVATQQAEMKHEPGLPRVLDRLEAVERRNRLYEASWSGYQRAIELTPAPPLYLNDGAVILHYYLEREFERAREMYKLARDKAQEALAGDNLNNEDRAGYKIALRVGRRKNTAKLS